MTGLSPSTDRDALIAALAEQARSDAPGMPEPEPEELLDYLAGRLAPEDEQRIARRLAADPAAARALLDLAELEDTRAETGERPADLAVMAGWREIRHQLPSAPSQPQHLSKLLPAVAASLLVATVGLGSWGLKLQSELHRPVANLVSLELPSGSRATLEPVRELPPGEPLRLVLGPAEHCPEYAAEVKGPRRKDRQMIEGLTRNEGGSVTFLLPRTEPGLYILRLVGCEPRRLLEEHRFRITADGRVGPGG